MKDKLDKITKLLKNYENEEVKFWREDFIPNNYAGHIGDSWEMGMEDGKVELAQEIMNIINRIEE